MGGCCCCGKKVPEPKKGDYKCGKCGRMSDKQEICCGEKMQKKAGCCR